MPTYFAGTSVEVDALFINTDTNDAADPTIVTLVYQDGNGDETTVVYDEEEDFITRNFEGSYTAFLDTTGIPGIWTYQWNGYGNVGKVVNASNFVVAAPPLSPSWVAPSWTWLGAP